MTAKSPSTQCWFAFCGEPLLEKLVGGPVQENIDNFLQISPLEWLPWGIPQDYIVSTYRYPVSLPRVLAQGKTALRTLPDYPALAVLAGDVFNMRLEVEFLVEVNAQV